MGDGVGSVVGVVHEQLWPQFTDASDRVAPVDLEARDSSTILV